MSEPNVDFSGCKFRFDVALLNLESANNEENSNQALEDYTKGVEILISLIECGYINGQNRKQVMVKIESYLRRIEEIKQRLKIIKPEREVKKEIKVIEPKTNQYTNNCIISVLIVLFLFLI